MLAGIILLMIVSMVVYGFYLKYFYFNKPGHRQKPAARDVTLMTSDLSHFRRNRRARVVVEGRRVSCWYCRGRL